MKQKPNLPFWSLWNLSFGFFGVQIAYALQSANISRIFATLGADPHSLSYFWILPPLMGILVQPIVGTLSDKTWTRFGRRVPYLFIGAAVAVLVMCLLPNAGSLGLTVSAAMMFGLIALMFLDTSINMAMQPFKMLVGDMVNEEQKAKAYSIQSFLCNAGSVAGYLFPFIFTFIGISNVAEKGVVPDSVIWSFYIGASILILCVIYTTSKVKEWNPQEYAEYNGANGANGANGTNGNFASVPSPDAVFAEALTVKPEVQAAQLAVSSADRSIDIARAGYYPTLSLSGGLGTNYYTTSGFPSDGFGTQLKNNFSQYIGLNLNVPIFNRFSTRNSIRSAKIERENSLLQLDNTKKTLYKEIQQVCQNAVTAQAKYESSQVAVQSSMDAFTLMQAKYENGKANITEFNESKNNYLRAASDLVQARYELLYQQALIQFYRGRELQF